MILGIISSVLMVGLIGFCAVIAISIAREHAKKRER